MTRALMVSAPFPHSPSLVTTPTIIYLPWKCLKQSLQACLCNKFNLLSLFYKLEASLSPAPQSL